MCQYVFPDGLDLTLKLSNVLFMISPDFDTRFIVCSIQLWMYKLWGLMKNQFTQIDSTQQKIFIFTT